LQAVPTYFAEFENSKLVAQSATSADIEKINREVIEGMRFRFISQKIISRDVLEESHILNVEQLQEKGALYNSGDELLEDILKQRHYRHSRQLRYLAANHLRGVLKIRFVLKPFSFVFLLAGNEEYHLVLETLDTDEATYIWHFEKSRALLPSKLKDVELGLSVIKEKGRHVFLDSNPANFTRVLHDYSNEEKGFIEWKDILEEKIK
jgi:hypothetical protein